MQQPYVSIVIPTYNDWDRLALCLDALKRQTYLKEKFEVIVINNHPDDNTPTGFAIPDGYKIITEKKSGSYAARNAGLLQSKGAIIGFTDSDCIPAPDWIENAVTYFSSNKMCSRIAGKVEIYYKQATPNDVELLEALFSFDQIYYVNTHGMGATANMFSHRHVFDMIGNFRDDMMSGGDLEWGRRAKAAGYVIHYVKNVIVKHPARTSFKELKSKARRVGGGHSQIAPSGKRKYFRFILKLIKSFKPNFRETLFIYKQDKIGLKSKTNIFLMRYQLQVIRALERFKVSIGKTPQRF